MPVRVTRRTVLQKVRGSAYTAVPQLVNTGFQVLFHSPPGVLFTFPSQYYALSVTKEYLALRSGLRLFRQGFSCLVLLWIPPCDFKFRLRGFHPLWLAFPKPFFYSLSIIYAVRTPDCTQPGLGSFAFARRYLRNRCFFLFLALLRCFSSGSSPPDVMDWRQDTYSLCMWVPPFRYPWILTYLQLPKAFRSLSRLSSALSAKASTLRSFLYDLRHYHSVGILFFVYKVFSLFLGCLESSFKTSDI